MPYVTITEEQANALRAMRPLKTVDRTGYKSARRMVFTNIRLSAGVPDDVVMSIEIDDRNSPLYRVVKVRPPKSRRAGVEFVPLEADAEGRAAVDQTPAANWATVPFTEVVAVLQDQGETMSGYKALGSMRAVPADWVPVPATEDADIAGVEFFLTPDNCVAFRV